MMKFGKLPAASPRDASFIDHLMIHSNGCYFHSDYYCVFRHSLRLFQSLTSKKNALFCNFHSGSKYN